MKYLLSLYLFLIASFSCVFASDWKMHPAFDGEILHLVETPRFVYFTSRTIPESTTFPNIHSLFRYDKEGEEIQALSTDNLLPCNTVETIAYCADKGYLAVVCSDFNICLLYDNGKTVNIPDYRLASLSYPKTVNSITFSPSTDRIYFATAFGYISVNDSKHEIAESRIYETPLTSVVRTGNKILVLKDNQLLCAPVSGQNYSLSDFATVDSFDKPVSLYSLADDKALMLTEDGSPHSLRVISVSDGGIDVGNPVKGNFYNLEYNRNGVTAPTGSLIYQFRKDGSYSTLSRPEEDWRLKASSYNLSEVWHGKQRSGIKSSDVKSEGMITTRDYVSPDAPSLFISTDMHLHPDLGLLVQNFGFDYNLQSINSGPLLISGYNGGEWINYAPVYTNPEQATVINRPSGFAIDPDNPDYVYVSSVQNGFARINLKDGADIIHMSKPSDPSKDFPGFVALVPDQKGENAWSCRFSAPGFDSAGNLWMSYADFDNQNPERLHLLCWKAEDRKNTRSSSDFYAPAFIEVEGVKPTNTDMILPLKYRGNRNMLVYSTGNYLNRFVVIDTNGTPVDVSDDKVSIINTVHDQDGNNIEVSNVRCMWEDPSSGDIWVGHSSGVFYFDPVAFLDGDGRVTRIKVARNDGTNLADYFLNEVTVNRISTDGVGRKWFATGGAGLVSLSPDMRTIDNELTTETSRIPDNVVYCLEYIPESNSMMVSTAAGLAEYFMPASSSPSMKNNVRAYPNPVRPDYAGYVTIDGLTSEALVKIVDASGSLVKELRTGGRGEVAWDVTNLQFKRVSSGVYFVLASDSDTEGDFSAVAKILVIN